MLRLNHIPVDSVDFIGSKKFSEIRRFLEQFPGIK